MDDIEPNKGKMLIQPTFNVYRSSSQEMESGDRFNIIFCGDLFINTCKEKDESNVEQRFGDTLKAILSSADISVLNLEAPLTYSKNSIKKSGPTLKMKPSVGESLHRIGFTGFTLANNHIMDFGCVGLTDTLKFAEKCGVKTCGAGPDIVNAVKPMIFESPSGFKIGIFSFCEQEFGATKDNAPGSAWISHPLILTTIRQYRAYIDFIIVAAHGGLEYVPFSPLDRQSQLRQLIDAGADIVIGHHPHVPQGWEKYNDKIIFYSLGNFIFDYLGKDKHPKSNWGYMVHVIFNKNQLSSVNLILTEQRSCIVDVIEDESKSGLHYRHLLHLSNIIGDSAIYEKYWQDLAVRLYFERYAPRLKRTLLHPFSFEGLLSLFMSIKPRTNRSHEDNFQSQLKQNNRVLLNLFRNESHRSAICKALSVLGEQEKDLTNTDISEDLDKLLTEVR